MKQIYPYSKASNAVLIGFNVKANREAKKFLRSKKLRIMFFNIIYEAIEYIEKKTIWPVRPFKISLGSAGTKNI